MATSRSIHHTNIILLLFLLSLSGGSLSSQEDLIINTVNGKVQGMLLPVLGGSVRAFLGIPYAKPPLGKLRFQPPEPMGKWEGEMMAAKFPNSCYQMQDTKYPGFSGAEMWNPNTPLSEDCLYLNVWSPPLNRTQQQALPVLVWIYGGGFTTGTSSLDLYDGRILSKSEGVVVVSMNYRLGALGFLSLPGNENVRGNAGLLDQRLALRWVANNIAFFGGDPSKVTLFGESAGAASVGFHLLSPGSHGLFKRAILQSGCPNAPWATVSNTESWNMTMTLASLLGCPISSAADLELCLQRADPLDVIKGIPEAPLTATSFLPTVDGNFLPDEPEVLLKTGNFLKAEVLFGLNKNEGTYFLLYGMPGFKLTGESPISRKEFLQGLQLALPGTSNVTREMAIFQYTDWTDTEDGMKNRDALGDLMGDKSIICPTLEFVYRYSQHGGNTFLYLFDHHSSTNPWPAWMGVMHGYEIEFVFGKPLNATFGYTRDEVNMSRRFMKHWANFARTGDPSISGASWPTYTPESQVYVTLNPDPLQQKNKMKAQQCHLWTNLLPKIQEVSDERQPCIQSDGTHHCSYIFLVILMILILT